MFGNLIESGSHAADLKRKGRFLLATSLFYALLFVATGVGSIYAYNARLDQSDEEYVLVSLMRFPPVARDEPARREEARPASGQTNQMAMRPNIAHQTPYHENNVASDSAIDVSTKARVIEGPVSRGEIEVGSPVGPVGPGGPPSAGDGPTVRDNDGDGAPPVLVKPTPAPTTERPSGPVRLTSTILTSKAISKPAPAYPTIAKMAHASGPVAVQVLIDEHGNVTSAKATSGHPLLQAAAVQAAYQARFTPTLLSGQPVKVTGVITYNFMLQ